MIFLAESVAHLIMAILYDYAITHLVNETLTNGFWQTEKLDAQLTVEG